MGTQFDSDVWILVKQFYKLVERCLRLWTQCGTVKIVENVVDENWSHDRGQWKLQYCVARLACWFHSQLLLMIEVSLACAEKHIVHVRLYLLGKRAVALNV